MNSRKPVKGQFTGTMEDAWLKAQRVALEYSRDPALMLHMLHWWHDGNYHAFGGHAESIAKTGYCDYYSVDFLFCAYGGAWIMKDMPHAVVFPENMHDLMEHLYHQHITLVVSETQPEPEAVLDWRNKNN